MSKAVLALEHRVLCFFVENRQIDPNKQIYVDFNSFYATS